MDYVEGCCKVQALLGSLNHIKHESSTAQANHRSTINNKPFRAKKKKVEGSHNLKGINNICLPKLKKDRIDYLVFILLLWITLFKRNAVLKN
jgi:hypothetical protein